jgi:hypothetical protein
MWWSRPGLTGRWLPSRRSVSGDRARGAGIGRPRGRTGRCLPMESRPPLCWQRTQTPPGRGGLRLCWQLLTTRPRGRRAGYWTVPGFCQGRRRLLLRVATAQAVSPRGAIRAGLPVAIHRSCWCRRSTGPSAAPGASRDEEAIDTSACEDVWWYPPGCSTGDTGLPSTFGWARRAATARRARLSRARVQSAGSGRSRQLQLKPLTSHAGRGRSLRLQGAAHRGGDAGQVWIAFTRMASPGRRRVLQLDHEAHGVPCAMIELYEDPSLGPGA